MTARKPTPYKTCLTCGAVMERRTWRNGKMESITAFELRKYCGCQCNPRSSSNTAGERYEDAGAYLPPTEEIAAMAAEIREANMLAMRTGGRKSITTDQKYRCKVGTGRRLSTVRGV